MVIVGDMGAGKCESGRPLFQEVFPQDSSGHWVIGVLLPIVLVGGNRVVFGQSDLLPSLSGYYHSDMRNWFVGSLWAIGSGLLVYLAAAAT